MPRKVFHFLTLVLVAIFVVSISISLKGSEIYNRYLWGGYWNEEGTGIVVDKTGNAYICLSTLSFGQGIWDFGLLKYDNTGKLLVQKIWGTNIIDYATRIDIDRQNNLFIIGYTTSFSKDYIADVFLMRADTEGKVKWVKRWNAGEEYALRLTTDDNYVYVAGKNYSFASLGADAFVLKFDKDGTLVWQKVWGGKSSDYAQGVGVDQYGNIYVAGSTLSFGKGSWDVFVIKLTKKGYVVWQKVWGGGNPDVAYDLVVDTNRNAVYVTGYTENYGVGGKDIFLLKLDYDGKMVWERTWGGNKNEEAYGMTLDKNGNIYLVGYTESFGNGEKDAIVLKFNPDGDLVWQKTWGGANTDYAYKIAVDDNWNVHITGTTHSYQGSFQDSGGFVRIFKVPLEDVVGVERFVDGEVKDITTNFVETNVSAETEFGASRFDVFYIRFNLSAIEKLE